MSLVFIVPAHLSVVVPVRNEQDNVQPLIADAIQQGKPINTSIMAT